MPGRYGTANVEPVVYLFHFHPSFTRGFFHPYQPMNFKKSKEETANQKSQDFCHIFVFSKKKVGLWERNHTQGYGFKNP
jgi:hypothetical protein